VLADPSLMAVMLPPLRADLEVEVDIVASDVSSIERAAREEDCASSLGTHPHGGVVFRSSEGAGWCSIDSPRRQT